MADVIIEIQLTNIVFSLAFRWSSPYDDMFVDIAGSNIYARAQALAEEKGLMHPFIYQNYASSSQDVFAGYGPGMRAKLQETQRQVDHEGMWRRLRKGYFTV